MNLDIKKSIINQCLVGLLSLACLAGTHPVVLAQEKPVELLEISPVSPQEGAIIPMIFDGKGRIDRVDGMEIVVGDRLKKFAVLTVFYTKQGKVGSRNQFQEGDMVGYLKNKNNEITALYKLE
ncbi:MAG: hypothetical protein KKF12_22430 [Proteobacteria bacterium]|nr:hypothetical protein [Desulfobacula sp.]MBU3951684.1 hypothetical protein [Pseudomonadota bacterium]MBU4133585.1 hypothetical protein [Pseudomonadota bacterium]